MKRRRKGSNNTCLLLDELPKRTKVHAQRKFAQGSNVGSPVITPVKEIEKQDKIKQDVLPEPPDMVQMARPHTEDFLTFLCFRGTSMLPPTLSFFNTAPADSINHSPDKSNEEPDEACPPIANINTQPGSGANERPFIAFGVRKRADPVLVSKHMDKKRRHALALQALRRKYQEQKMAKIRAVTISKLSEKVSSTKTLVHETRSVAKNETAIKKDIPTKTQVKIVSSKRVKITRSSMAPTIRTTLKPPVRRHIQKKMCLRSYRGKFIHQELNVKKPRKSRTIKVKEKENSSEFSSDDDQPLLKTVKVIKTNKVPISKISGSKISGVCGKNLRKPSEVNFRITRALSSNIDQSVKRKIQITRSSLITKTPFVKLTPPKLLSLQTTVAEKRKVICPKSKPIIKTSKVDIKPTVKVVQRMANKKTTTIKGNNDRLRSKTKLVTENTSSMKNRTLDISSNRKSATFIENKSKHSKELLTKKINKSPPVLEKLKRVSVVTKLRRVISQESNAKNTDIKRKETENTIERRSKRKLSETESNSEGQISKSPTIKNKNEKVDRLTSKKIDLEISPAQKTSKIKVEVAVEKDAQNKSKKLDLATEESAISRRPTRKTKEAAAIYMEILGHKLVHDDNDDGDVSIDSFPELPNVRKTEQRENELKAKVKSKTSPSSSNLKVKSGETRSDFLIQKTKNLGICKNEKCLKNLNCECKSTDRKELKMLNSEDLSKAHNKNKETEIKEPNIKDLSKAHIKNKETEIKEPNIKDLSKAHNKNKETEIKEPNIKDLSKVHNKNKETEIKEPNIKDLSKAHNKNKETEIKELNIKDLSKAHSKNKETEIKEPIIKDLSKAHNKNKETEIKEPIIKDLSKAHNKNKETEIKEPIIKEMNGDKRTTRGSLNKLQTIKVEEVNVEHKITPLKTDLNITNVKQAVITNVEHQKIIDCDGGSENSEINTSKKVQNKKKNLKSKPSVKLDCSFSDSDEEPLSKLALGKIKTQEISKTLENKEAINKEVNDESKLLDVSLMTDSVDNLQKSISDKNISKTKNCEDEIRSEKIAIVSNKPKRECTKRPQNYLPLFSSSEDDEKYFYGFMKSENDKQNRTSKSQSNFKVTPSADLLCKDVDKRFGKGKVNMSTEQIEKWLNDSALAKENLKSENDELLKFEEKMEFEEKDTLQFPKNEYKNTTDPDCSEIKTLPDQKIPIISQLPCSNTIFESEKFPSKPLERKHIFRKERKTSLPNCTAFSANNESSVYAFEADTEDTVNTPFRRPTRRPSSTGTSRSESSSKYEDLKVVKKINIPSNIQQDISTKKTNQEVPRLLNSDQDKIGSVISSFELKSSKVDKEPIENKKQVFYMPLKPSQVIQATILKPGTRRERNSTRNVVASAKQAISKCVSSQKNVEKSLKTGTSMYPPPLVTQKTKSSENLKSSSKTNVAGKLHESPLDSLAEIKNKIPSSPSASSSSSVKVNKKPQIKQRLRSLESNDPIKMSEFPSDSKVAVLLEAPVFHPNEKEFQDPLEYIEKIRPYAEKFGICRIIPLATFKPECKVSDDMRFTAYNQYVHKMLHRWGPNFKELMAITKYLKTQNIALTHPPWIGGMEIDLPRLYQTVQSLGGLKEVIEKKKWSKVSELMKIPRSAQDRVTKLDDIYCKYLLPYDTLSPVEREKLFDEVETEWAKRESRSLIKSQQNISALEPEQACESESDEESEECIVKGRNMALSAFYRIARNTMSMWFKNVEPSAQEVEQEFWKHVTVKQNHICVHSGSIDSGNWGYGFAVSKNSPFARHAWNLKVLTNNSGSILRSMAPVMGLTVPTLHVGMVFSACCWYRDPHSLPWIEYLHTGGNKIWYGIPDSMSDKFHKALMKLVPNYCRNKSLWLPSDTAMVPPNLLVENGVSLCKTIQEPGQFIVVFPKAFTSSICSGYLVSESVYFAPLHWLKNAQNVFKELHESCEPSMFSLEKLIISIACDTRSNVEVLKQIIPTLESLQNVQKSFLTELEQLGLKTKEKVPLPEAPTSKKKKFQNESGDYECDVCCKNLYISWVVESQEVIYCLDHASEYLTKGKIEVQNCKLMYTYENKELISLIEKANSLIQTKLQKKIVGKSLVV